MILLPALPFECVFDILFRYEAMAHLDQVFGADKACIGLADHVYSYGLWMDVVTSCYLVQKLKHPAHALFLLVPVHRRISESVKAWEASQRCTIVLPPPHILIHSMKAFLPAAKRQQVFEWLHTYEIHQQRTVIECVALAQKTAANYLFTREWFKDYGVKGKSVGESIFLRAEKEKQTLQDNLKKAAEHSILKTKKKITPIDSQCALDEAELKHRLHLRVLSDVEAILDGISTATFHCEFSSVVGAAMALAKQYPLIKWNIKLLVIKAGFDKEDMSAWYAEREMCRSLKAFLMPKDADPLRLLREFEKK